jgi:hypothetical protein
MRKVLILSVLIGLLLSIQPLYSQEHIPQKSQDKKESGIMHVKFYAIDRQKVNKGGYLGFAELKQGKLDVQVSDLKLENIIKGPYTTMTGEKKRNVFVDKRITYQPGTTEHLRAIAIECYRFGYIAEIAKENK